MKKDELFKKIEEYVLQNKEAHYRMAYSYVKNTEDALDIVQESIIKAFSSYKSLKKPQYLKTWYYRILINTSLDFLRKSEKEVLADDNVLFQLESGVEDKYPDIDLNEAVDKLSEKYKSVVILKYFEDMTFEEISIVLDENVNTVKTRLYTSLQKLKLALGGSFKE